jgi:oxygen-independent coproporphyrinogen-3 oxidase
VDTIYFGGGTPSLFGAKGMVTILNTIRKAFDVSPTAEITFEANPDSVDSRLLRQLKREGFNRVSLGIQCDDDGILQAIGRPHTYAQAVEAVDKIRRAGLQNLSLDLIYGLPGQTLESWMQTLQNVLQLNPEHISCYGLKVEEGTPLFARRHSAALPDDEAQAEMYLHTVDYLARMGYQQYETSHFAKGGKVSRHNLRYWTLGEYAGFGPGAHSDFGGVRYSYVADLEAYIAGVSSGSPIVEESERIPQPERFREYLIFRLRTVRGIGEEEYGRLTRMDFAPLRRRLEDFAASGWAMAEETEGERRWHFTPQGFLLSNRLIGELLEVQEEQLRGGVSGRGRPGLQDTRPVFDN